jgi:hypothetical protein
MDASESEAVQAAGAEAADSAVPDYPCGVVFVRSGWVPEAGFAAVGVGAFGGALSAGAADGAAVDATAAFGQQLLDGGGADATATLTLVRPFGGASPPPQSVAASATRGALDESGHAGSPGGWVTYDNPLSDDGGTAAGGGWMLESGRSTGRTAGGAAAGGTLLGGSSTVRSNPLAAAGWQWGAARGGKGWDVEAGASLMPPRPAMTAERAIRRAVVGGCKVRA